MQDMPAQRKRRIVEHHVVNKTAVIIAAIVAIFLMELFALSQGIDGTILKMAFGAIIGVAGFAFGFYKHRKGV